MTDDLAALRSLAQRMSHATSALRMLPPDFALTLTAGYAAALAAERELSEDDFVLLVRDAHRAAVAGRGAP